MTTEETRNKIEKLRDEIRRHDYLYYVRSQPVISDKEYDSLMEQLNGLEAKFPELKTGDSPTVRVSGGMLDSFKTVKHKQKMLSLDNTYSFDELKDWQGRVGKVLGNERREYAVELKIDGLSANITYRRGKLVVAATRGDGETGEDVTGNIKTIRAIPLVLLGRDIPDFIEVRGEVYMEKKDFLGLNKEREKADEIIFANPRNAASGSLKLLDTAEAAKRRLNFFAHSLGEYSAAGGSASGGKGGEILTQEDFLNKLQNWGIRTNPQTKVFQKLDDVIDYCVYCQGHRESLSYEIDGMVIKLNCLAQQKRLGATLKSPRWAVAYKFPARQATTEVVKINLNVGRTGVITPVVELKPVECSGVTIKHATLHNFDEIKRLKVKEGDRVLIERAGDVIPKVVKVVQSRGKKPFVIPKVCPACSGKVVKEKEEDVAYRCINPSCPAQLERALMHFASRDCLDIEGMGEAVIKQLVDLKLVRNFAGIYKLTKSELAELELFKEKKINNLLSAIQKSKLRPLSRVIYGFGIRHVGEKAAYVLAKQFKAIDNLLEAKKENLEAIYEIGPVMAASIVDYFSLSQTKKLIDELKQAGLNFKEEPIKTKPTPLSGKTVVFSGELIDYSRSLAEELVIKAGGSTSSSVSKNIDFVVVGKNPGSKYEKAEKLGVKIINEGQFSRMLQSG